jgi:hypothetical protein
MLVKAGVILGDDCCGWALISTPSEAQRDMDADSLDEYIAGPPTPSTSQHLSYPTPDLPDKVEAPHSQAPQLFKDRIYIGNLHPSVDECVLGSIATCP